MPVEIVMDSETGVGIATCTGTPTSSDAREGAAALWATPGWGGEAAIWDFRQAEFDVSPAEARELAQFILQNQPGRPSKMAFVTARDVDFGMARVFEAHRNDPATAFQVFRDYDEAMHWVRPPAPA